MSSYSIWALPILTHIVIESRAATEYRKYLSWVESKMSPRSPQSIIFMKFNDLILCVFALFINKSIKLRHQQLSVSIRICFHFLFLLSWYWFSFQIVYYGWASINKDKKKDEPWAGDRVIDICICFNFPFIKLIILSIINRWILNYIISLILWSWGETLGYSRCSVVYWVSGKHRNMYALYYALEMDIFISNSSSKHLSLWYTNT